MKINIYYILTSYAFLEPLFLIKISGLDLDGNKFIPLTGFDNIEYH